MERTRVKLLDPDVARKIAAGEVIDRPNAIIRELMDNAVDSGASRIDVEIEGGGIEKIRVSDNGCGMTEEDLRQCAHPHATSKISSETDLMNLSTLGFRGEALSSMAAVSRLQISSSGFRMNASVTEDHIITPCAENEGTIVMIQGLFENFPARRQFLKRPATEGNSCRLTFEEKVLPRPDIAFSFYSDGEQKLMLPKVDSLKERFIQTMDFFESKDLFYEIKKSDEKNGFSFSIILGDPSISRSSRKDISIYVNGRKIQEYSLVQAIVYGSTGYFPNGTFPVACIFIDIDSSLVDFNIHPAKREVRFKDISELHHAISTSVKDFYREYTSREIVGGSEKPADAPSFGFYEIEKRNTQASLPQISENSIWSKKTPASMEHVSYGKTNSRQFQFPSRAGREKFFSSEIEISSPAKTNYIPDDISRSEKTDSGFHYVGCALGTFIIAEKDGVLYIIDQHAAHERIIYNRIIEESSQRQELLIPYVIKTDSVQDDNYLEAIKDKLSDAGYDCMKKEDGTWEFLTVPIRWKGTEEDLKKDVLDRRINPGDMINAVAASTACRQAVMDGTVLEDAMASRIARDALALPDPHCPHGRPVYTKITREQLFQLVKRT